MNGMKIIDNEKICDELAKPCDTSCSKVKEILLKAKELKCISRTDVLTLMKLHDDELLHEVYEIAIWIKKRFMATGWFFLRLFISRIFVKMNAFTTPSERAIKSL